MKVNDLIEQLKRYPLFTEVKLCVDDRVAHIVTFFSIKNVPNVLMIGGTSNKTGEGQ